jgi:lambda family phage portal protein
MESSAAEARIAEARREGFARGMAQYSGFAAGNVNSRLMNFSGALDSSNKEIKRDIRAIRAHSRTLARDNAFSRRFIQLCGTHIVGPNGIAFDSVITGSQGKPKKAWNNAIKAAWKLWGRSATVDGMPWADFEALVLGTVATDGEAFVRKVSGFDNAFGFALELIDADRVDSTWNRAPSIGLNEIAMGVEIDSWGRRVAFWVWTAHPTDYTTERRRVRIPASEIVHIGRPDRTHATRFLPWSTPVMPLMNLLGRYWNSEIAAANWEADRLGFLVSDVNTMDPSDGGESLVDPSTLDVQSDMAQFIGLPPGVKAEIPNLQHPSTAFDPFSKAMLRGIASGLGVAYHSLTGDVGAANYSSARVALLEERDNWRRLQGWFTRSFHDQIFGDWLNMAVLSGNLSIPVADPGRICAPRWYARGWEWIDPEKDANANKAAIGAGFTTLQRVCAEQGDDWEEILDQRAVEQAKAKKLGLFLDYSTKGAMPAQEASAEAPAGTDPETENDTADAKGDASNE